MSPLTTSLLPLEVGEHVWVDATAERYVQTMRAVSSAPNRHRALAGRTFSGNLYVAVRGAEACYLVKATRIS
mgnify:CR=1 FL=1